MPINYRPVSTIEDMRCIVELEVLVWGLPEIDVVPVNILHVSIYNGGLVLIAENDQEMGVGFSISMPAKKDQNWILWSHVTGVHPDFQRQNIGLGLKNWQRQWAFEQGYQAIGWTFDPLQSGNANFNLNRLGVTAKQYHHNFYGEMTDRINNQKVPSDRLEAYWDTNPGRNRPPSNSDELPIYFLIDSIENRPILQAPPDDTDHCQLAIAIPIRNQDITNVLEWQKLVRNAFKWAFSNGFYAFKFVRDSTKHYYLLKT